MIGKSMKMGFQDQSPKISLTVLGTLCFVTLVMCQTRFRITKEISQEIYPPVLRSRDYWFLYSVGNPDRFKCVLKAFVVVTSPVLSLISTLLLLLGKVESNPYFFLPWLFLTVKGLLLIQTDNVITIMKDLGSKENFILGFHLEDMKWLMIYSTIFMIDLIEVFSFCEIFDLFLVLWNHHPGFSSESASLEAVKKEIADIMDALSKCSLGSLSKISLSSAVESEENVRNVKKPQSRVRFSLKEDEKIFHENKPPSSLRKSHSALKEYDEDLKNEAKNSESEISPRSDAEGPKKCQNVEMDDMDLMESPQISVNIFSKSDLREIAEKTDCFSPITYNKEFALGAV